MKRKKNILIFSFLLFILSKVSSELNLNDQYSVFLAYILFV